MSNVPELDVHAVIATLRAMRAKVRELNDRVATMERKLDERELDELGATILAEWEER